MQNTESTSQCHYNILQKRKRTKQNRATKCLCQRGRATCFGKFGLFYGACDSSVLQEHNSVQNTEERKCMALHFQLISFCPYDFEETLTIFFISPFTLTKIRRCPFRTSKHDIILSSQKRKFKGMLITRIGKMLTVRICHFYTISE